MPLAWLPEIDAWIAANDPHTTRAAAIRRLIKIGLKTSLEKTKL
jgi:hypothetical protein